MLCIVVHLLCTFVYTTHTPGGEFPPASKIWQHTLGLCRKQAFTYVIIFGWRSVDGGRIVRHLCNIKLYITLHIYEYVLATTPRVRACACVCIASCRTIGRGCVRMNYTQWSDPHLGELYHNHTLLLAQAVMHSHHCTIYIYIYVHKLLKNRQHALNVN